MQDSDGRMAIASAWAEDGYLYSGRSNGNGAFVIYVSADTTNPPATCDDRRLLRKTQSPADLTIQTSQQGSPSLAPGVVPFVTITAVDHDHLTGTFDGTGNDGIESNHILGSFDVPICWND